MIDSKLLYVDHVDAAGPRCLQRPSAATSRASWRRRLGHYERDDVSTSWLKIENPAYSQMAGRRELFEARTSRARRRISVSLPPVLRLHVIG